MAKDLCLLSAMHQLQSAKAKSTAMEYDIKVCKEVNVATCKCEALRESASASNMSGLITLMFEPAIVE